MGQVTVMVGSPLGLLFVSTHLKFSKRFYVTWERSKSSFFLEACTARGAAQTRTRGSLICFSESSLQVCQVLNIDISLLDKRELWNHILSYFLIFWGSLFSSLFTVVVFFLGGWLHRLSLQERRFIRSRRRRQHFLRRSPREGSKSFTRTAVGL